MDDDLFTYEVKIPELSYSPSIGQQIDDLDYGNLDVYERKLCYDECEKIYAEAMIFINKRLVRMIEVTVEQWLDLKYGDHTMVSNVVKESVITTWLIRSYKKQFKEYMEIKKQKGDDEEVITNDELSNPGDGNLIKETKVAEIFRIETNIFQFETPLCEAFKEFNYLLKIDMDVLTNDISGFKTYNEYKDAWLSEWNKDIPWVPNTVIQIGDMIYFESNEWYENLEDDELKGEALNSKAIFKGSKGEQTMIMKLKRMKDGLMNKLIGDDDDDIGDLEDYLIRKVLPYYVNEEEERSKEKRCKLLRIPYVKPPTCKLEKFEKTCNNDKNLSEIQLEHVKEDELVTMVVKVVHECRYWIGKLEWWFEQDIDDEGEEDE
ncbi:hypothetical protein Tco_0765081 [Tanacetum coccineum]